MSPAVTCSCTCPFKSNGCYAEANINIRRAYAKLDEAAVGLTADQVIEQEAGRIDRAFRGGPIPQDGARGGRDLRLHVAGDVGSKYGAMMLAGAALRWRKRGGGSVWTTTHAWREVPRKAWGGISVLASVELPEDIERARAMGYPAAIVVPAFGSEKAYSLPGWQARIVPCPAMTRHTTCVQCRLCLERDLLGMNAAIAFAVHGPLAKKARQAVVKLQSARGHQ